MGSWGPHPTSNDSAADWFGELMDPIARAIDEVLRNENSSIYMFRAACWLLERVGEHMVYPSHLGDCEDIVAEHYDLALTRLRLEEAKLIEVCNEDPEAIVWLDSVQMQIKGLEYNMVHWGEHGLMAKIAGLKHEEGSDTLEN